MNSVFYKATGIALLAAAFSCRAGEVIGGVGITQFSKQSNGFWYQEGDQFPHNLKLSSTALSLKWYSDKNQSGWQFGAGYYYIGRVHSDALATASDANYNPSTRSCNGPCWPLSHWIGSGEVHGAAALSRLNWNSGWFVETGLVATRPSWVMTIPDLRTCATCAPFYAQVRHNPKIQIDPLAAIGYRFKNVSVVLSVMPTHAKGDEFPAVYKAYSPYLSIEYTF